jgi:phosphatidylglycerol---prolipoprotein diacylglyceryl transferase
MYPELFHIGSFTVSSYGVMLALAFVVAGFTLRWQLRKRGVRPDFAWVALIGAIIGGILGAKIHYLIINPDAWPDDALSGRGLVWFGGLFGGTIGVILVALIAKVRVARVADGVAFALATAYAVGRVGCFLVGDDYGKPTDLPWGIAFPKGSPPVDVPVHPTQLYEILASLFIFALLVWVVTPLVRREGVTFYVYLILAGVERFLVEFVRTNPVAALGLTQQQWISIALFVVGIAGAWWLSVRGRPLPATVFARKGGATTVKGGAVSGKGAPASPAKPAKAKDKSK